MLDNQLKALVNNRIGGGFGEEIQLKINQIMNECRY